MESESLQAIETELDDLQKDYKALKELSTRYLSKLEELDELQTKCSTAIVHQKYRMKIVQKNMKNIDESDRNKNDEALQKFQKFIENRQLEITEIEQLLPKENGVYLKIILGNVNVSICNKNHKFRYKDEYEKFKLILSIIGFCFSILNLSVRFRPLELCNMFLLVWYFCTLTIRESILKINGSRIKGWWRFHHFLSTAMAAILLIWPETEAWIRFRQQFMWFNLYLSVIQYFQFRYQRGVLYRLKALGERDNMDITIEGFHSWMWRGISFLLPLLFIGYFFQIYNAYTLFLLSSHATATWHVPVLSFLFFVLFLGNLVTTCLVIPQKIQERSTNSTKRKIMGQQFDWSKCSRRDQLHDHHGGSKAD